MRLIIIGCGKLGSELALAMQTRGHEVIIVDTDPEAFDQFGGQFKGKTIVGIGFDKDILEEAGIDRADAGHHLFIFDALASGFVDLIERDRRAALRGGKDFHGDRDEVAGARLSGPAPGRGEVEDREPGQHLRRALPATRHARHRGVEVAQGSREDPRPGPGGAH